MDVTPTWPVRVHRGPTNLPNKPRRQATESESAILARKHVAAHQRELADDVVHLFRRTHHGCGHPHRNHPTEATPHRNHPSHRNHTHRNHNLQAPTMVDPLDAEGPSSQPCLSSLMRECSTAQSGWFHLEDGPLKPFW